MSTAHLDPLILGALHTDMATIIVSQIDCSQRAQTEYPLELAENSSYRASCRGCSLGMRDGTNQQLLPTISYGS
jgi:hypothetical protein